MTHEDFKTAMKIVYAAMKQPSMVYKITQCQS